MVQLSYNEMQAITEQISCTIGAIFLPFLPPMVYFAHNWYKFI